MSILDVSAANLRLIIVLAEKRERLLAEVASVEAEIRKLEGAPTTSTGGKYRKVAKTPRSTGRRGKVKERIVAELEAAGKSGVHVKELAATLGLKSQNLHVWFHTTGKKLGVKKIGPGKYRL